MPPKFAVRSASPLDRTVLETAQGRVVTFRLPEGLNLTMQEPVLGDYVKTSLGSTQPNLSADYNKSGLWIGSNTVESVGPRIGRGVRSYCRNTLPGLRMWP